MARFLFAFRRVREQDSFNDFGLVSRYFCFSRLAQHGSYWDTGSLSLRGPSLLGISVSMALANRGCWTRSPAVEANGARQRTVLVLCFVLFSATPCCAIFLAYFALLTPHGRLQVYLEVNYPGRGQRQSIIGNARAYATLFNRPLTSRG